MAHPLTPALDHPAYHQAVKLRGYNRRVDVFGAVTSSDAARVLRALQPTWSRQDHAQLAARHEAESERLREQHIALLNQAHFETFGVPRGFFDYRISAIGREEYSETAKEQLRAAAHGSTYHKQLSAAHLAARRRAPAN